VAQAVVGLGNPGPEYRETRHNVGHRVVDGLARRLHCRLAADGGHLVGRGQWRGETVYLVKLASYMNQSGPAAARVLRRLAVDPADLVLVFDDLDLPLGTVRVRMKGSAGGHNGVHSVLVALDTEAVRRVKVGIGRPGEPGRDRDQVVDHVLSGFEAEELPVVEAACAQAVDRTLRLLESRTP
jgi:PTH1 family peptidyl-tRNA hydrolase